MWRKGMFRVHLFGGGNAFSEKYPHPSGLVHAGDQMFFLDMPAHPWKTLRDYQVRRWEDGSGVPDDFWDLIPRTICKKVKGIILTHPHPDHGISGIELAAYDVFYNFWLRNSKHFKDGKPGQLPYLIGEKAVVEEFRQSVKRRLDTSECYPGRKLGLDDYFRLLTLRAGDQWGINDLSVTLLEADHCTPAAGVRIDYDGRAIVHTGDTRYLPHVLEANLDARLIIGDCAEILPGGHSTSSQYEELISVHPKVREKLWLYHVPDCKIVEVKDKGFNVITDPMYIDITKKGAVPR